MNVWSIILKIPAAIAVRLFPGHFWKWFMVKAATWGMHSGPKT